MQKIATFDFVRTWDREVTIRGENCDISTTFVPCIAPWIEKAVPTDEAGWELFGKADVAELAFVCSSRDSDDSDCALEVLSKHAREFADPSGKVAIRQHNT